MAVLFRYSFKKWFRHWESHKLMSETNWVEANRKNHEVWFSSMSRHPLMNIKGHCLTTNLSNLFWIRKMLNFKRNLWNIILVVNLIAVFQIVYRMRFEMGLQLIQATVFLRAIIALVWCFTRVLALMSDQWVPFGERFIAMIALKCFDSRVNVQVLRKGQSFSEFLGTVGACERSDIHVRTKMRVESFVRIEWFAAFVADDGDRRFLVVGDVCIQISSIIETGLAHLASVRVSMLLHVFAVLRWLVVLQVELVRVHLNWKREESARGGCGSIKCLQNIHFYLAALIAHKRGFLFVALHVAVQGFAILAQLVANLTRQTGTFALIVAIDVRFQSSERGEAGIAFQAQEYRRRIYFVNGEFLVLFGWAAAGRCFRRIGWQPLLFLARHVLLFVGVLFASRRKWTDRFTVIDVAIITSRFSFVIVVVGGGFDANSAAL